MNLCTDEKQTPKSELSENFDYLRKTSLFSGFPLEALKVVAYLCVRSDFVEGDFLFQQGDDDGQAFFVLDGKLEVSNLTKDSSVCWEIGAGELLGGLSLFGSMTRQFSVRAISNVRVLTIDREIFGKAISQFPDHRQWLLSAALQALRDWEGQCLQGLEQSCPSCVKRIGLTLL